MRLAPILLTALLATPAAKAQAEPSLPPAPGQLVDVGDTRLHLYCTGEGSPAVVLDAGLGDWSLQFRDLQERVSGFTTVCSYDRAGYGWSEPTAGSRTSRQIAGELRALLETAGVEGPYVLVGHSFGGLNVISFAARFPELVAAVVLLDASHPDQNARLAAVPEMTAAEAVEMDRFRAMADSAARGELTAESVLAMAPAGIPEALRPVWARSFVQPDSLRAALAEYDALEQSQAEVRAEGALGDIPLVVIAHGLKLGDVLPPEAREAMGLSLETLERYEQIWRELQEDHLLRSSDSRLIAAENSTHYVHYMEPNLVLAAIRELVTGDPE